MRQARHSVKPTRNQVDATMMAASTELAKLIKTNPQQKEYDI